MNETPTSTALKRRRQQTSPLLGKLPSWSTYDADLLDNYRSTKRFVSNNAADVSVSLNGLGIHTNTAPSDPAVAMSADNSPLVLNNPTTKGTKEGNQHPFETPDKVTSSTIQQQQQEQQFTAPTTTATAMATTNHKSTPPHQHQHPPSSPMSLGDTDALPPSPSDSHVEADLDLRKATLVRLLYLRQGGPGPSPLAGKAPPKTSFHHHHHQQQQQPLIYSNTTSNEVDIEQQLEFPDPLQTHIAHPVVDVHSNTAASNDIRTGSSGSRYRGGGSGSRHNRTDNSNKQKQAAHLCGDTFII